MDSKTKNALRLSKTCSHSSKNPFTTKQLFHKQTQPIQKQDMPEESTEDSFYSDSEQEQQQMSIIDTAHSTQDTDTESPNPSPTCPISYTDILTFLNTPDNIAQIFHQKLQPPYITSSLHSGLSQLSSNCDDLLEQLCICYYTQREPLMPPNSFKYLSPLNYTVSQHKKTLLLDLDETLVHSEPCSLGMWEFNRKGGAEVWVTNRHRISFMVRGWLFEFLKCVSQFYEIAVFTASSADYANAIVDTIDPKRVYVKEVLSRDACSSVVSSVIDQVYTKELSVIKNRNINDIVLVDNSFWSGITQMDNFIPIKTFKGDKNDKELKKLAAFLIEIKDSELLPCVRERFKFRQIWDMLIQNIPILN